MYEERTASGSAVLLQDIAATGRILVVDDDQSFGGFAVAALESRGHDVDWAACVSDGLASLYAARYDLAILDLRLPDGSGLDLLRTATDSGLLTGSSAVILTGHEFEAPNDIRVFHKPNAADLDTFLDRVGLIVAMTKRRRSTSRGTSPARSANDRERSRKSARIELVLYTSASSEKCRQAIRTVQSVLGLYETSQVQLTVLDLATHPDAGDADAVVFTPTLVKRGPGSRTYIVGNLDDPRIVTDLLEVNGVRRRKGA